MLIYIRKKKRDERDSEKHEKILMNYLETKKWFTLEHHELTNTFPILPQLLIFTIVSKDYNPRNDKMER